MATAPHLLVITLPELLVDLPTLEGCRERPETGVQIGRESQACSWAVVRPIRLGAGDRMPCPSFFVPDKFAALCNATWSPVSWAARGDAILHDHPGSGDCACRL